MKTIPRILLLSFALPCAVNFATGQTTWTGNTDTDWNTANNWTNGVPLANGSNAPVTIDKDGANVTMSAAGGSRDLSVSGNGGTAPVLNITQDLSNNFSSFAVGSDPTGSNYSGVVNHTAGTLSMSGSATRLRIGANMNKTSTGTGNSGTYVFGGGSATAPAIDVSEVILVGNRLGESGTLTLQDHGSITSGVSFLMGQANGDATLNIVGGNLTINLATGISAGTEGMTMAKAGGGTTSLNATIDSSGFSTINVGGDVRLGNSTTNNDSSFHLSLGSGFTPTVGSKYVIISATGAFTGGEAFNNFGDGDIINAGGYDFEADYTGGEFSVTAIPEPGMAGLFIGAAALAVLCVRRRR